MTTEIQQSRATEICQLHAEIGGYLRMTLEKAIRIGELLTEQKAELQHGEWLPWVQENLPFTDRSARDYMRFYDRREQLKSESISDMADARRLLAEPSVPRADKSSPIDYLTNDDLLELSLKKLAPLPGTMVPEPSEDWDYEKSTQKVNELFEEMRQLLKAHPELLSLPNIA